MDSQINAQDNDAALDKTLRGEDFDFEFDEDFESEVAAEYTVMDAMRFDREAGTASCNFEIDEDEVDAFGIPIKPQDNDAQKGNTDDKKTAPEAKKATGKAAKKTKK